MIRTWQAEDQTIAPRDRWCLPDDVSWETAVGRLGVISSARPNEFTELDMLAMCFTYVVSSARMALQGRDGSRSQADSLSDKDAHTALAASLKVGGRETLRKYLTGAKQITWEQYVMAVDSDHLGPFLYRALPREARAELAMAAPRSRGVQLAQNPAMLEMEANFGHVMLRFMPSGNRGSQKGVLMRINDAEQAGAIASIKRLAAAQRQGLLRGRRHPNWSAVLDSVTAPASRADYIRDALSDGGIYTTTQIRDRVEELGLDVTAEQVSKTLHDLGKQGEVTPRTHGYQLASDE